MANEANLRRGKWAGAPRGVALPAECTLPVPPIPTSRRERWGPEQRKRWRTIWQGPAAVLYDDAQTGPVALLIDLEAAHGEGKLQAAQLTEYRRLLADLMLTPQAISGAGYRLQGWPS